MPIGEGRGFEIKVILDNVEVYSGSIENAPEGIRNLKYSKVNAGNINTYFVYSELQ